MNEKEFIKSFVQCKVVFSKYKEDGAILYTAIATLLQYIFFRTIGHKLLCQIYIWDLQLFATYK